MWREEYSPSVHIFTSEVKYLSHFRFFDSTIQITFLLQKLGIHTHTHIYHNLKHTYRCMHIRMHTHTHSHTFTCTMKRKHSPLQVHTQTHARMHALLNANITKVDEKTSIYQDIIIVQSKSTESHDYLPIMHC